MALLIKQTETFRRWERTLSDPKARALIAARLNRLAYGLPGDVKSVGNGVSEIRIHYGPGYRIYFTRKGDEILLLLRGGDCWQPDGTNDMNETLYPYDPAEALTSDEAIDVFVRDAFESGDAGYISHALGVVARAKGMSKVAEDTGLSREALYRSLTSEGNPTLKSMLMVMQALGLELTSKRTGT